MASDLYANQNVLPCFYSTQLQPQSLSQRRLDFLSDYFGTIRLSIRLLSRMLEEKTLGSTCVILHLKKTELLWQHCRNACVATMVSQHLHQKHCGNACIVDTLSSYDRRTTKKTSRGARRGRCAILAIGDAMRYATPLRDCDTTDTVLRCPCDMCDAMRCDGAIDAIGRC